MNHLEFKQTQNIRMAVKDDFVCHYGIPSLFKLQYNLIARIAASTQFLMENLTANPDFNFTLLGSELNWSKNVNEECHAPNQIGAMDPLYCVLLGLRSSLSREEEQC
jgi:hypothetical protein